MNDARQGGDRRRLVLASSSTTRLKVLREAGIDPIVSASGVDEDVDAADTRAAVAVLSERKASAVSARLPGALVLGCDSLLDVDGEALGKPRDASQAVQFWHLLRGRDAELLTGHCLIAPSGEVVVAVEGTTVAFGEPTDAEIGAYVASGEPLALAGAFSIDGLGAPFVDGIRGDVSNVLGLSLPLLRTMLRRLGFGISEFWASGTAGSALRPSGKDGP